MVLQSVETHSMCESDIATPLWLRGGGVRHDPDVGLGLPRRRLFRYDSSDNEQDPQGQDNMETESVVPISTIESPTDYDALDYMVGHSCEDDACSTDVSSTRKRRVNK